MVTGPGKILVVDDDSNLLEIIKMRLESADYEVVTAQDVEDALTAVKEQPLDMSIIDLYLAENNGISLMEDVHKIIPDIPVIILTAYGSIETAFEAMQKGAYSYMTKPFDPGELLSQIEKALKSSRKVFNRNK
jgi:two-component system response regulator GlrR